MPKLTPDERAALEAQLAEDDADDDTDEVTIGRPDGTTFTGSFRRALQLGFVTLPKADSKTPAKGQPRNVSVFGQRGKTGT
jgi:hypothetical protein